MSTRPPRGDVPFRVTSSSLGELQELVLQGHCRDHASALPRPLCSRT